MMNWFEQSFDGGNVWFIAGRSRSFHFCLGSDIGTSQSATQESNTSSGSGAGSAVASGANSQTVGAGSIGVGENAKYLEEGATDLSNSDANIGGLNLQGASNVSISDPSVGLAENSLQTLSNALANAQQQAANSQQYVDDALATESTAAAASSPTLLQQISAWLQSLGLNWYDVAGIVAILGLGGWLVLHRRKKG